jgi:hypothetical protein
MKIHHTLAFVFAFISTASALAHDSIPNLPSNISIYAKYDVGRGQQCLVGTQTDDDGMNEKPVVYLEKSPRTIAWHFTLPLPPHTYQARATHCTDTSSTLYVLVQGDTQPEQSLSQTLLEIVALNRSTGIVIASRAIDAPNINAAHTTWVEDGNEHFIAQDNALIVTGKYALLSNRSSPESFSLKAPQDLSH